MKTQTFQADHLHAFTRRLFEASGATSGIAHIVSNILVNANLAGHDSHGVLRLPLYLRMASEGRLKLGAEPTLVRESVTTLVLDGNDGLGHLTAYRAIHRAIEKARTSEICSVSFTRLQHIGRVGEYAEIAARAGCIGIITVGRGTPNTLKVLPFGGSKGSLGTNPFSVGVPTGDDTPFVLDFATSVVAEGKLQVARSKGLPVAEDIIVDKDGNDTTNPLDFYDGGFLRTFAGHKGYAMSLMNCLLGGLSGNFTDELRFGGGFIQILNISAFTDPEAYQQSVRTFLNNMKTTEPAPGVDEVLVPGEFEARNRKERLKNGVEIPDPICQQIQEWSDRLSVSIDASIVEPEDSRPYTA